MLRSASAAVGALTRGASRQQLSATLLSLSDQASTSCSRAYSSGASDAEKPVDSIGNEKVQKLAAEVMGLTVLESSWLSEILRRKLNIQRPAYGAAHMSAPMSAAAPAASAPAAAPAPAAEKKEQTEFEVKLSSFSTEGKIKVIKEIRAITSLGLKEAKELVEKAPVVIKGNVSKADAENMKKQIEAAGGKVELL